MYSNERRVTERIECTQCGILCYILGTTSGWISASTCVYIFKEENQQSEPYCLRCTWISSQHTVCKEQESCHIICQESRRLHIQYFGRFRSGYIDIETEMGRHPEGEYEWLRVFRRSQRGIPERLLSIPESTERHSGACVEDSDGEISTDLYNFYTDDGNDPVDELYQ